MPCDCDRCCFSFKGGHLGRVWVTSSSDFEVEVLRRRSASFGNYRERYSDGFGSSSNERRRKPAAFKSNADWMQGNGSIRPHQRHLSPPHRTVSNPRSFQRRNPTRNGCRLADAWGSTEPPALVDQPDKSLTQPSASDLDSVEKSSEGSGMTASTVTESSISSVPVAAKRVLSAAEKETILSKTRFLMRAPVNSTAAIPRLDENNRPRRPLVRPVYSSPSARVHLRPARLVAYRSEKQSVRDNAIDAEEDLTPSPIDEVQAEESGNRLSTAEEDAVDEDEIDSDLRYIRYTKGFGVQLVSLSSASSHITGKGLYCDLAFPRSNHQSALLSLPLGAGADMLNIQDDFKLPFSMVLGRLAEFELDHLRKTGTFVNRPPPFFLINRNIRLPTTILPEYVGGDEILDCECCPNVEPGCGPNCINRLTHVECEPDQCKLGDRCTNQRFQKRQWAKLCIEYMGEKGWGVVLAQEVHQGDLIIECVGELVDIATCKERCRNEYRSEKHSYLLSLYSNIIIDATRRGNLGRFCNHSCEPSCETQKWSVRGSPRIGIFASQDLPKGTEVTLDYNFERIGLAMTKCLCGSQTCRGFLSVSKPKKRRECNILDFDYDVARDGPPILVPEEQIAQLSHYLNHDRLPDSFLSMLAEVGAESTGPAALLLRNVVLVHSEFMDRLEYNPDHPE